MTESIGIFGDSSASPNQKFTHSWVELLSKDININNYSEKGASLVFVYSQLLKYGNNYKKIIIFIPPVGRLWMPNFKLHNHFVNEKTAQMIIERFPLTLDQKILKSIQDYFMNVWDYDREILIQRSLVDSIRMLFSNSLIIPVTPTSIYGNKNVCMQQISLLDYEFYDVNENTPDWGRTCHMNRENNRIFYEKILEWALSGNFTLELKDFKYPEESKKDLFNDENYR